VGGVVAGMAQTILSVRPQQKKTEKSITTNIKIIQWI